MCAMNFLRDGLSYENNDEMVYQLKKKLVVSNVRKCVVDVSQLKASFGRGWKSAAWVEDL